MPYRDRVRVEQWLQDFWDTHNVLAEKLSVLDDGFTPGPNSGIVIAALHRTPGLAYLSARLIQNQPRWMVTFEARAEPLHLDAAEVHELAMELGGLAAVCEYLQTRTDEATTRAT